MPVLRVGPGRFFRDNSGSYFVGMESPGPPPTVGCHLPVVNPQPLMGNHQPPTVDGQPMTSRRSSALVSGAGLCLLFFSARSPPPPPRTKVSIVGKNEIYNWATLSGHFLVHKLLGPKSPLPPFKHSPAEGFLYQNGSFRLRCCCFVV